jgi:hypothetical protein
MKTTHRSFAFLACLASILPLLASPFALGVVAAEGAAGGGTPAPAAPAAPAAGAPAPAAPAAAAPAPAAPAADAPAAVPGVSARLAGAFASLQGGTPAVAAAELATARANLTQAQSDLTATRASLKSTETALASIAGFLGLKPAEVLGKTDTEIDTLCAAKLTAAATAQLAGRGFSPSTLPAASGGNGGDTLADLQAAMAETKDPVRLGQLAAKANALRDGKPSPAAV